MEYLIDIHGEKNVFLGERPTVMEECVKVLAISQGVSPQTFAANRRSGTHRVIFSKTGGKMLQRTTKVAGVLYPFFMQGDDFSLSLDVVEKVLDQRAEEFEKMITRLAKESKAKETLEAIAKAMGTDDNATEDETMATRDASNDRQNEAKHEHNHDEMPSSFDPAVYSRWKRHHKISIVCFLEEFKYALDAEQLDLEFDYFAFHRSTWGLLEEIQSAALPLIQSNLNEIVSTMANSEEGTTICPGLIMHMACDPRKAPNMIALKDWVRIDDTGLKAAAEIMGQFIEREGDAYTKLERKRLRSRGIGRPRNGDDVPTFGAVDEYRPGETMSDDIKEQEERWLHL